jgi:hypothetical protein
LCLVLCDSLSLSVWTSAAIAVLVPLAKRIDACRLVPDSNPQPQRWPNPRRNLTARSAWIHAEGWSSSVHIYTQSCCVADPASAHSRAFQLFSRSHQSPFFASSIISVRNNMPDCHMATVTKALAIGRQHLCTIYIIESTTPWILLTLSLQS